MMALAWLVPALPAAAFVLILFAGRRMPGRGAEAGILAAAAGLVMSLAILVQVAAGHAPEQASFAFLHLGGPAGFSLSLDVGQHVDGLTAVMFVVVCLVSLCSQVYSLGYMRGDRRYTVYYAFLSLFTAAMLNLVLADNLFQLLVSWELVGICSYFLIGHWWEEDENANAAIKAFIVTKTGDVPFLFGIFVLTVAAGTANIPAITAKAAHGDISTGLLTVSALLLFGGAIGKSAQFPLHVWLPDAMAGPTPVSALIHAATMVAAGVYLVARLFAVYAPSGHALAFVGTIGAITMLIAALLAVVQDDIKRVLAYSTVSQLAYMMAGLGLGPPGYAPGVFHLFTHAFFKALLFYAAGSVIHACRTNSMREMGGLRRRMPVTFWAFVVGALALAGVPPFAGFFSKDAIVAAAFHAHADAVFVVAVLTAFLTALYVTRAVLMTFFGEYRGEAHPHESPPSMTGPMVVLAALSVGSGFLSGPFERWVAPAAAGNALPGEAFSFPLAGLAVAVVLGGIWAGWALYARGRGVVRDPLLRLGPLSTLLARKYYLDELYERAVAGPVRGPLARAVDAVDRRGIDGAVNATAVGAWGAGHLLRRVQSPNVQRSAALLLLGLILLVVLITRI